MFEVKKKNEKKKIQKKKNRRREKEHGDGKSIVLVYRDLDGDHSS